MKILEKSIKILMREIKLIDAASPPRVPTKESGENDGYSSEYVETSDEENKEDGEGEDEVDRDEDIEESNEEEQGNKDDILSMEETEEDGDTDEIGSPEESHTTEATTTLATTAVSKKLSGEEAGKTKDSDGEDYGNYPDDYFERSGK